MDALTLMNRVGATLRVIASEIVELKAAVDAKPSFVDGTITAVNPGPPYTVRALIAGGETGEIAVFAHYTPVVNDRAWFVYLRRGRYMALGTLRP